MTFTVPVALGLLSLIGTPSDAPPDRGVDLIGFGLVVGLDGTGSCSTFTRQVVEDVTRRELGIALGRMREIADRRMNDRLGPRSRPRADSHPESIWRPANSSVVFVSATLRAGASKGDKFDLTVNCVDDASSLRGGTLIFTPLKGADGGVYAVGQGPLSVSANDGKSRAASIKNGGLIEVAAGGAIGSGFTPPRIRGARGETR